MFSSSTNHPKVIHQPGQDNIGVDAHFCNPAASNPAPTDIDAVVCNVDSLQQVDVSTLLVSPSCASIVEGDFHLEQRKDLKLKELIDYLEKEHCQAETMMQERLLCKL